MQQRRFRPGDVVDDYCPRERRITDHAVVAMIADHIKQTRCCVCDAEHEYKDGKVPARRKKPQPALFTQVLEGLQGPQSARLAQHVAELDVEPLPGSAVTAPTPSPLPAKAQAHAEVTVHAAAQDLSSGNGHAPTHDVEPLVATAAGVAEESPARPDDVPLSRDEGPVRRSLIRATLPRPEGQPPPTRVLPDFTIRQPTNGRGPRPAGRRRGGHQPQGPGNGGPMRFGRGGGAQGHGPDQNYGQRPHGRNHGPNGGRSSRRGGKKR